MSMIGGNTSNHQNKEQVVRCIDKWREALIKAGESPALDDIGRDISGLTWQELQRLKSRLQIRMQILNFGTILG